MAALFKITEGWTERLGPFTLLNNAQPFPGLDGYDIVLMLTPIGSTPTVGTTTRIGLGVVNVPDQTMNPGQITYDPDPTDFVLTGAALMQTYLIHWKLTDVNSKVAYVPNGPASEVTVCRA